VRHGVDFFERQFQRQVRAGEFTLNPFEELALEHLRGDVLDLGCGLGNLALAAARRGHAVLAIDASPTAIERLSSVARAEGLPLQARLADLSAGDLPGEHDTIVAIGLLMFFPGARALELLRAIQAHVRPGGVAVVNVLIEGTTWLEPFEPGRRHLFAAGELERHFVGWTLLATLAHEFPAHGGALKRFATLVAGKPGTPPVERSREPTGTA
jgi:tellurite methyltransferase